MIPYEWMKRFRRVSPRMKQGSLEDLSLVKKYKTHRLSSKELNEYPKRIYAYPQHTPKPLTPAQLEAVCQLNIDTVNGRVYNWDGRELGYSDSEGRVHIGLVTGSMRENRIVRRAHIIWWKAKGYWPRITIDHKDVNCDNDRIDNLREASMSLQNFNKRNKK